MFVLIQVTTRGLKRSKTFYQGFPIQKIITQYREPIDNDVLRSLASKMAFDNDARIIHMWAANLPKKHEEVLEHKMKNIFKFIA